MSNLLTMQTVTDIDAVVASCSCSDK